MKVKDLAALLGMNDDRPLRGEDGILEKASRKIFEKHGFAIITRTGSPSGVKLSNNPEEIRNAALQLTSHHWAEQRRASQWEKYADHLAASPKANQLGLFQ